MSRCRLPAKGCTCTKCRSRAIPICHLLISAPLSFITPLNIVHFYDQLIFTFPQFGFKVSLDINSTWRRITPSFILTSKSPSRLEIMPLNIQRSCPKTFQITTPGELEILNRHTIWYHPFKHSFNCGLLKHWVQREVCLILLQILRAAALEAWSMKFKVLLHGRQT